MADMLELQTNTKADTISIDGESYPLVTDDDFGIADQHHISQQGKRMAALFDQEVLSASETKELEQIVKSLFAKIVPTAPAAVAKKLGDIKKLKVINFFTQRQTANLTQISSES